MGCGRREVRADLPPRPDAGRRVRRKGSAAIAVLEEGSLTAGRSERQPRLRGTGRVAQGETHLEQVELLEDEPLVCGRAAEGQRLDVRFDARHVDRAQRLRNLGQLALANHSQGEVSLGEIRVLLHSERHESAQRPRMETLGCGVVGNHPALGRRGRISRGDALPFIEHLDLGMHELLRKAVAPDLARDLERRTLADPAANGVAAVEPLEVHRSRPVANHRLEDPSEPPASSARWDEVAQQDGCDEGCPLPHGKFRYGLERAAVVVARGKVQEQIGNRAQSSTGERIGAFRADARQSP